MKKYYASREDAETELEDLDNELAQSKLYSPALALVKFLCIGCAFASITVPEQDNAIWPNGISGITLLFLVTVLFCEILPERIAEYRSDAIVHRSLPLLRLLRVLAYPVTELMALISRFTVRNLFGIRAEHEQKGDKDHLADEIRAAVEDRDEGEELAEEAKDWIENIVEFKDEDVAGVMTPRTELVCVVSDSSLKDAVNIAVEAGHSRLPVYEEKLDNIIGTFYVRDAAKLLATGDTTLLDSRVTEHIRPPYFVPESKKIGDLFREFKKRRVHIAIVVDEYGGTAGVVSLEDVIEEIVGEIVDEYDPEVEEPLTILEKGQLAEVDAKVHVSDINEALSVELPESDDYETIGGFVFGHLGRIPKTGESFQAHGLEITIISAGPRVVERIRVRVMDRERAAS